MGVFFYLINLPSPLKTLPLARSKIPLAFLYGSALDEEKDKLAAKMEKRYADHQTVTEDEKRFREILGSTGREGVEELLEYLKVNDFFIAPGSVSHHSNWKGGLVNHSLKVYDRAMQIRETMIREDPSVIDELKEEKVAVAALLHDICKADAYTID